jgi:hypothetical protein
MKGKKPLVDYNMFHLVIFEEYFNIMQSKAITKAKVNDITKCK